MKGPVDAYTPHVNFSEMFSALEKQSQLIFEVLCTLVYVNSVDWFVTNIFLEF